MNFHAFVALVALAGTFPALTDPAQAGGGDSNYEAPAPGTYNLPVIKLAGRVKSLTPKIVHCRCAISRTAGSP